MLREICVMVLLLASAGSSAQMVHKEIDATGRVTYTDQPATTPSWHFATVPALDVADALAGNFAIASRLAALVDADEAARRLRQTLLERKLGVDRLPGELARGAGASAANQRYRLRQQGLQLQVEQALQRARQTSKSLRDYP